MSQLQINDVEVAAGAVTIQPSLLQHDTDTRAVEDAKPQHSEHKLSSTHELMRK
ncbi:hypothetical protein PC116_g17817 [Phytophthora cactorum]|uniref:Uncharacterized protein n=1 Tax=Phytophthora cactorum TaxID=29920 RepID=A0A8T1CM36_9STRA|nr:hypothetical protein Pcac1_g17382 [Phytophthora cactorum]KAG2896071.1 hypothetical protein PC114_g15253 [Phytophthora cactorum]KAG2924118.1 hypothetical protein PC117_g15477 [Phytophthora cactorum]KAG3008916.1 hypothetical protein PC120_g15926 [Phytophthora cactorum]KAG3024311.1 hypothetical protein PC119_g8538 [Phytophthora cactorum]